MSGVFATLWVAVGPAQAITNGQPDGNGHPNVGVMVVDFGSGPERLCSGELIAPTQFLTAAHCTARFLLNNPSVHLDGVTFDPTYDPSTSTVVPAVSVTVDPLFGKDLADLHDLSELFSSSDLAGLKDVDGLGQLAGPPWAAAEFAQDAPGLELGVGAFAGSA
jgi:hypothetical protein